MEVHDHDYTGLDSDAEQRDIAHPDGNTEVVSEQLLKDEAAGQSIERGKNEDSGLGDGVKHHIEQQEDDEEHHRQDELQSLFGPQLEFILPRPLVGVTGRQRQLFSKRIVGAVDEAAVVLRVQVNVNVAGERPILIANHGWPTGERNLGHLCDRNLRASRSSNQDPSQLLDVIAKIAVVADIDWISLAAFDVFGDHFAADS